MQLESATVSVTPFHSDFTTVTNIVSEDTGSNVLEDHRIKNVRIRGFFCIMSV